MLRYGKNMLFIGRFEPSSKLYVKTIGVKKYIVVFMNKNFVIINYNTQDLTEHCIMSVNKFVDGARIFVFDNSDKGAFVNKFDNVVIFDNTSGKIIDFDKFLSRYHYKNRSAGRRNGWASAKHAYTIEKLIEMMDEPFILLDSDVLLKKDASDLFDEGLLYCGEVVCQPNSTIKRVLPYICFINVPMCKKHRIHYFNEKFMHGLCYGGKGSSDRYDTGAWFYSCTLKYPRREIRYDDYIVHYHHGSWVSSTWEKKETTSGEFIEANREYWS